MEEKNINADVARQSAPERDVARHSLTIKQASQLFAELEAPRAPRSVQRFCEAGYLDCVRVRGAKGDQFFVSRESIERYAEELKQIAATAKIGEEPRHDAPERVMTRQSAPERATDIQVSRLTPDSAQEADAPESNGVIKRLTEENMHLQIDNRAKEQAINFLLDQSRDMQTRLQDVSYRLGSAEARVQQLEAPKPVQDAARQSAPERATDDVVPQNTTPAMTEVEPKQSADLIPPKRSVFGRIFGGQ